MALSGNFLTSDSGQGGGNYFGRLIFEWWRDSWGRSGSQGYHNISYTLKSYGGSSGYWQYCYNNSMSVDGTGYSRGQTQVYGAGATTILSGSKTLYTDGAGNRSFGASAQAGIYTAAINTSGSGSWALDNIPMHSQITNASGNQNDEVTNPWVEFTNPSGTQVDVYIELPSIAGVGAIAYTSNVGSRHTWNLTTTQLNQIRAAMVNVNSTTIRFVVYDNLGGAPTYSWIDRTVTIVNGNPVFTTATFKDANAATVAVTGNDQYLIQNYSQLEVKILAANKAVPQKSATMVKYNMTIGSINQDVTFSNSDITQNLGTLGIGATATLNVKAIDSRTNNTTVPLTVNVLPYNVPQITATAQRVNNFETSTNFHIEGVISRLTISGTDKNTVNTTNGVRYRYKKTTDVSWGSWVNVASTTTNGNVSTTDFNVPTALDRNFAWDIQIEMTDRLNTTTASLVLPVGIPIFRIGLDGNVYNNEVRMLTEDDLLASNPYKFFAYQSSTISRADGNTYTVPFNTEVFDTNNNYNPATGEYTVPVTGYYQVNANLQIWGGTGVAYLWDASATLVVDGVSYDQNRLYVYDQGRFTFSNLPMANIHYLTAGQKVKVNSFADTQNGSNYSIAGSRISANFSAFLVAKA